jgi:hypothetical protein
MTERTRAKIIGNGPYEVADIPGMGGLKIIVVSGSTIPFFDNPSGSKSPWWMIEMRVDDKHVLSSTVTQKKYSNFAELFGFHVESRVVLSSTIANRLFISSIIHEDCIVVIPNGGYVADLEHKMYSGAVFNRISLVCLGWIKGKLEQYHRVTFLDSILVEITPDLDRVFVRFRVVKKKQTFIPFTQVGAKKGESICYINLRHNTLKDEGG